MEKIIQFDRYLNSEDLRIRELSVILSKIDRLNETVNEVRQEIKDWDNG